MDLYVILIIAHIAAAILGVGGATFIEIHLNQALRDGTMSPEERKTMKLDVLVTRIGMVVGLLSGLGFVWLYYANDQLFRLQSPVFWTKMGLFVVIIVNAYLLHKHKISLFWGSALSFVTWWYVMLLGIFLTEGVRYSWVVVIGVYLTLLIGGAYGLHYLRERNKEKSPTPTGPAPASPAAPSPAVNEAPAASEPK